MPAEEVDGSSGTDEELLGHRRAPLVSELPTSGHPDSVRVHRAEVVDHRMGLGNEVLQPHDAVCVGVGQRGDRWAAATGSGAAPAHGADRTVDRPRCRGPTAMLPTIRDPNRGRGRDRPRPFDGRRSTTLRAFSGSGMSIGGEAS